VRRNAIGRFQLPHQLRLGLPPFEEDRRPGRHLDILKLPASLIVKLQHSPPKQRADNHQLLSPGQPSCCATPPASIWRLCGHVAHTKPTPHGRDLGRFLTNSRCFWRSDASCSSNTFRARSCKKGSSRSGFRRSSWRGRAARVAPFPDPRPRADIGAGPRCAFDRKGLSLGGTKDLRSVECWHGEVSTSEP